MRLARNPLFAEASNLSGFPRALSALTALADLSEDALKTGVVSGVIHPRMTAREVKLVVQSQPAEPRARQLVIIEHKAVPPQQVSVDQVFEEAAREAMLRLFDVVVRAGPISDAMIRQGKLVASERPQDAALFGENIRRLAAAWAN